MKFSAFLLDNRNTAAENAQISYFSVFLSDNRKAAAKNARLSAFLCLTIATPLPKLDEDGICFADNCNAIINNARKN